MNSFAQSDDVFRWVETKKFLSRLGVDCSENNPITGITISLHHGDLVNLVIDSYAKDLGAISIGDVVTSGQVSGIVVGTRAGDILVVLFSGDTEPIEVERDALSKVYPPRRVEKVQFEYNGRRHNSPIDIREISYGTGTPQVEFTEPGFLTEGAHKILKGMIYDWIEGSLTEPEVEIKVRDETHTIRFLAVV